MAWSESINGMRKRRPRWRPTVDFPQPGSPIKKIMGSRLRAEEWEDAVIQVDGERIDFHPSRVVRHRTGSAPGGQRHKTKMSNRAPAHFQVRSWLLRDEILVNDDLGGNEDQQFLLFGCFGIVFEQNANPR